MLFLCEKSINSHAVPVLRAEFPYGVFSSVEHMVPSHIHLHIPAPYLKCLSSHNPNLQKVCKWTNRGGKQNQSFIDQMQLKTEANDPLNCCDSSKRQGFQQKSQIKPISLVWINTGMIRKQTSPCPDQVTPGVLTLQWLMSRVRGKIIKTKQHLNFLAAQNTALILLHEAP